MIAWVFCGVVLLLFLWISWAEDSPGTFVVLAIITVGITSCNQSEWHQSSKRKNDMIEAEQERRQATPHVIREADGCKVYQFKNAGYYHYFTRCKGSDVVTTEKIGSERCGKNCTRRTSEVITTKGNDL